MGIITKILRKNTSAGRVVAFAVSNFIGLAIVLGGLQFYLDARTILGDEDSFVKSDYLVVNKKVTGANLLGGAGRSEFGDEEIADIEAQPWVRRVGRFESNDFRVMASVRSAGRGMSTSMFFESIPDNFVDVPASQWVYRPGSGEVPIILSKDYLTLYNFGFAASAGLPQLSEGLMGSIPLDLVLTSEDGSRRERMVGHVAGFSNRLNTILVPEAFMAEANAALGSGERQRASRLIIDTNSPGDVAIGKYLEEHGLEAAGDKRASSAAFLLKVVTGVVLAVGIVITVLSLLILLLSVSLIMEKNRDKIHSLLMLGYMPGDIGRPYVVLIVVASVSALVLALVAVYALRGWYVGPLEDLGARPAQVWLVPVVGIALAAVIVGCNAAAVSQRVLSAFRR